MATGSSGSEGRRPEDTNAGRTDATNAGRSADEAQRSEERTRESEQRTRDAATQAQASAATANRQNVRTEQHARGVREVAASANRNSTSIGTPEQRWYAGKFLLALVALAALFMLLWFYGGTVRDWWNSAGQPVANNPPTAPGVAPSGQQAPPAGTLPLVPVVPVAPTGPVVQQTYAPPADVADQILNLERQIEKKERMLSTLNPNCPDDRPEYDALVARIAALRQKIADLRATSHEMVVQHGTAPVMQMHRNDGQSIQYSGKGYYTTTAMDPETARYAFDAKRIRAEEQRDAAQREARILKATRDDRHEELMEELKRNRRLQENPPKQTHVHTHQHAYPTTTVRYVVPAPYCNY